MRIDIAPIRITTGGHCAQSAIGASTFSARGFTQVVCRDSPVWPHAFLVARRHVTCEFESISFISFYLFIEYFRTRIIFIPTRLPFTVSQLSTSHRNSIRPTTILDLACGWNESRWTPVEVRRWSIGKFIIQLKILIYFCILKLNLYNIPRS